jgi:hypothetical protein
VAEQAIVDAGRAALRRRWSAPPFAPIDSGGSTDETVVTGPLLYYDESGPIDMYGVSVPDASINDAWVQFVSANRQAMAIQQPTSTLSSSTVSTSTFTVSVKHAYYRRAARGRLPSSINATCVGEAAWAASCAVVCALAAAVVAFGLERVEEVADRGIHGNTVALISSLSSSQ